VKADTDKDTTREDRKRNKEMWEKWEERVVNKRCRNLGGQRRQKGRRKKKNWVMKEKKRKGEIKKRKEKKKALANG